MRVYVKEENIRTAEGSKAKIIERTYRVVDIDSREGLFVRYNVRGESFSGPFIKEVSHLGIPPDTAEGTLSLNGYVRYEEMDEEFQRLLNEVKRSGPLSELEGLDPQMFPALERMVTTHSSQVGKRFVRD